jgi:hypothetical protein
MLSSGFHITSSSSHIFNDSKTGFQGLGISRHHLSPPPPPRVRTARTKKIHQYFWKKLFSWTSASTTSFPSASTWGGFLEPSLAVGPAVAGSRFTLTCSSGLSSSLTVTVSPFLGFFFGFGFGAVGMGFPLALARSIFFRRRSSSAESGGGVRLVTDAEKIDPSGASEIHRSMVCLRPSSKLEMLVMVELPLGSRMRRRGAEEGSGDVDVSESKLGGVHDSRLYRSERGS